MEQTIDQTLASGQTLVADGATGTMLMAAGLPPGVAPELWNVKQPEQIIGLHRAYIDAGSQIILTNTFGGSRIKLGKLGLAERSRELNLAGAALARQAANGRAYVAGDLGPTGELMQPFGPLTFDRAVETFSEQAAALAEGGVDALWIETMTDLDEARAAVTGAHQATGLPVLCSLSFGRKGRTMMGVKAGQAAETLWPLGLAAVGANCGEGLDPVEEALRQMAEALPGVPLIAKPNAGLPKMVAGKTVYDVPADAFAIRLSKFATLGAKVVGACCGSNPEYIEAMTAALHSVA
ncbi:MAG TPA: homocysteine S-methyltransferase family protein [Anaerolineales bacterium]